MKKTVKKFSIIKLRRMILIYTETTVAARYIASNYYK